MDVLVVDHPLAKDRLSTMRDARTDSAAFRAALHELTVMLIYEATREAPVRTERIHTPVARTDGYRLANPPLLVPVLRAGLGMADQAHKLIPDARWILDSVDQRDIVARSQARADVAKHSHALERRLARGSVAVYPLGSAVFYVAIVDVGDDPRDQVPQRGFRRIFTSRYYAIYGNC